jgi:hypothetical protein
MQSDIVFFKGIADYVRFNLRNHVLYVLVLERFIEQSYSNFFKAECSTNKDFLIYRWKNSLIGSWFNLELIYLFNFKRIETVEKAIQVEELRRGVNYLLSEFDRILERNDSDENVYIKRQYYSSDIIRVHHCLIENLERNSKHNCKSIDNIDFKFSSYGIPSGKLIVKGFDSIEFIKLPAIIVQFFFLNKTFDSDYSYKDFNEFQGAESKQVSSNNFRLIINSINNRVSNHTSGIVKELIQKQESYNSNIATNRYKWNININL